MGHHAKAQEFLQSILEATDDLPYEPSLLSDLFSLTAESSTASLEAVADTLSRGAGLAVRVLSMANSAFYGLQSEVSTLPRAVNILGLAEVRNLVLALGVSHLAKGTLPETFALKTYWYHQVSVATAAKLIAEHAGHPAPETLYTAGLLHDIGKLLIAVYHPDAWEGIQALKRQQNLTSDIEAEEAYWGLDHSVLAAHILSYWDLPAALTEPINWHHHPHLAPEFKQEAAILYVADSLLHRRSEQAIPLPDAAKTLLTRFVQNKEHFRQQLDEQLDQEHIAELVAHLT